MNVNSEEEFSFKFPEIELDGLDSGESHLETLSKINEYLDRDLEAHVSILCRLQEFEKALDRMPK